MRLKKITILVLIILSNSCLFGQAPMNFKTMDHIYQNWLGRGACDTMYYTDKLNENVINSTIKIIASKKSFSISELFRPKQASSFTITSAEQKYLIEELIKLKKFRWPPEMFENSKMISINDTRNVFKVTHKYPKNKANNCSIVYTFSKPIYIRKNNICLYLNQEQYSDTETQLTYNFYLKVDGEWQEYANCYINMGNSEDNDVEISPSAQQEKVQQNHPSNPSNDQIELLGKKAFSALQTKNEDSLTYIFPTLDELIAIVKAEKIKDKNIYQYKINNEEKTYQASLQSYIKSFSRIIDSASALNIDLSRSVYIKSQLQNINNKDSGNILIYFESGKNTFNVNILYIFLADHSIKIINYILITPAK